MTRGSHRVKSCSGCVVMPKRACGVRDELSFFFFFLDAPHCEAMRCVQQSFCFEQAGQGLFMLGAKVWCTHSPSPDVASSTEGGDCARRTEMCDCLMVFEQRWRGWLTWEGWRMLQCDQLEKVNAAVKTRRRFLLFAAVECKNQVEKLKEVGILVIKGASHKFLLKWKNVVEVESGEVDVDRGKRRAGYVAEMIKGDHEELSEAAERGL